MGSAAWRPAAVPSEGEDEENGTTGISGASAAPAAASWVIAAEGRVLRSILITVECGEKKYVLRVVKTSGCHYFRRSEK